MHPLASAGSENWGQLLSAALLVMVRVSGLMVFAPIFSSNAIPVRIKAVFALAVSILLAPVAAGLPMARSEITVEGLLGELGIGLVFGLSLALLNEMLTFAGQLLGIQFSLSLVNLLDPNSAVQTPIMGQMFSLMGSLVLLGAGLHRTLIAALLRSFAEAPLGGVVIHGAVGPTLAAMAGGVFVAALQLAAPVLTATVLVEVSVALLGRLSPQLPVMSITVPAKTIVGYVVLIGSLALWPRFIEARFAGLLDAAVGLMRHA
jgi:flagellar biosynthetic protein FliR